MKENFNSSTLKPFTLKLKVFTNFVNKVLQEFRVHLIELGASNASPRSISDTL